MDLGFAYKAIGETNCRNPFPLTPPPAAIHAPQPGAIPNRMRDGNGLDLPEGADELEVHLALRRCIIGVSTALTLALSCAGRNATLPL